MSRLNLAHNVGEWLKTATAGELVVLLRSIGMELAERGWPCAGSCHLGATELQRFIDLRPTREDSRR